MRQRLLFVTQGAPGGIGRAELLVEDTLAGATDLFDVDVIRKSSYPEYLMPPSLESERDSAARLTFRFMRTVARSEFDLILLSHINFIPLSPIAKLIRPRTRIVLVGYGIEVWRQPNWFVQRSLRTIDQVWVISEFSRIAMREVTGLPDASFRVLPLALSRSQLSDLTREEPHADNPPFLLSVSRLEASERYKGIDDVIEALPELLRDHPGLTYRVIGSGSDVTRLKELARRFGVSEAVTFIGSVDNNSLKAQLRACSVFVLPSAKEGFGFVLIEAMAAGCAVIGARSGATPEIVNDGGTGLLVPYGDSGSTAVAIHALLSEPRLRARLGAAGRSMVLARFTPEVFSANFVQLTRSVLD